MDTLSVVGSVEAALSDQLVLAGDNPSVAAAGETLLAALRPAVAQAAMALAEQAAAEVAAQLDDYDVKVILEDGEPSLSVTPLQTGASFSADDLAARLTLRLPETLKAELEDAARSAGDSINAHVVKALSGRRRTAGRARKRITETFQT